MLTLSSKPTRLTRKNVFFLDEWFDCKEKTNKKEIAPSFSILRSINLLEKNYNDLKLYLKRLSTERAVAKLRMNDVSRTGPENYAYLQTVWESGHMQSFADFFKWYRKHVPTLEASKAQKDEIIPQGH